MFILSAQNHKLHKDEKQPHQQEVLVLLGIITIYPLFKQAFHHTIDFVQEPVKSDFGIAGPDIQPLSGFSYILQSLFVHLGDDYIPLCVLHKLSGFSFLRDRSTLFQSHPYGMDYDSFFMGLLSSRNRIILMVFSVRDDNNRF